MLPETEQYEPPVARLKVSAPPPVVVDERVAVPPTESDVLDEPTVTTRVARLTVMVTRLVDEAASYVEVSAMATPMVQLPTPTAVRVVPEMLQKPGPVRTE